MQLFNENKRNTRKRSLDYQIHKGSWAFIGNNMEVTILENPPRLRDSC